MSRGLQASVFATVFSMGCRPTVRPRGADDGARARHALARASSLMGPGVLLSGGCRGRLWQAFVWALRPRTSVAPATPTLARRDGCQRERARRPHIVHTKVVGCYKGAVGRRIMATGATEQRPQLRHRRPARSPWCSGQAREPCSIATHRRKHVACRSRNHERHPGTLVDARPDWRLIFDFQWLIVPHGPLGLPCPAGCLASQCVAPAVLAHARRRAQPRPTSGGISPLNFDL